MKTQSDLTALLHRATAGDEAAFREVFAALYGELRGVARRQVQRRGRGDFLDTTEIVHASFVRLSEAGRVRVEDRQHFLRYAARVMRSVVVDTVRERQAQRRGGGEQPVTLNTNVPATSGEDQILQVHEALEELLTFDERMVRVVEMRYFAGMTETEIAAALGISERTVRRVWERARLWLAEAMSG